jgi:O-antigen ligase
MEISQNHKFISVIQASLLFAYSIYAFFFARNIDSMGNSILLGMSLLALTTLSYYEFQMPMLKGAIKGICLFSLLCFLTIILPIWTDTEPNWVYSAICKCIFGLSIVMLFSVQSSNRINTQSFWIIFLFLCVLMILQNSEFYIKESLNYFAFEWTVELGAWNEKYHTFWLVIFFWPVMFTIRRCFKYKKLLVICLALIATMTSYSESAKLALIISIIIYFVSYYNSKITWKIIYWGLISYVLLFPLIFQFLNLPEMDWVYARLYERFLLFDIASNAIMDNFLIGKGFGSSLSLNIIQFLPEHPSSAREWLKSYETFPGNHPHNFVALIWLEFGLLGALISIYFINRANKVMIKLVNDSDSAPYIMSIITTATVLFSFSWSIWQTDVVLTYIMFFSCLCFLIQTASKTLTIDATK